MLVKINGKEVEVGPSKHIQEKLDTSSSSMNQKSEEQNFNYCPFMINGQEVDMNNPDDIQRLVHISRKIGGIGILLGIVLLGLGPQINWADFSSALDGLTGILIPVLLGGIFIVFIPQRLQKRLDELKKQGKVPSKHQKNAQQKLDV